MENLKKRIYSLSFLERKILPFLLDLKNLEEISKSLNLSEQEIIMTLQILETRKLCEIKQFEKKIIILDSLGKKFLKEELPEFQVLRALNGLAKTNSQLKINPQILSSALGELKKNGLANIEKSEKGLLIKPTQKAKDYLKNYKNPLQKFSVGREVIELSENEKIIINKFRFRKGFLKEETKKTFSFNLTLQGEKIAKEIRSNYSNLELIESLTSEMLKNSSWREKEFRHYDVSLNVGIQNLGRRHPMLEANNIIRDIFVEMGFKEMKGPIIECAFWNNDVMWFPQDHPSRDDQDTFYLEGHAKIKNKDYLKNVCEVHEKGIKRTHTLRGEFSEKIATRRLLRTHSTATTFRTLADLSEKYKKGEDINGKYFYVAHNFRNEAVDATHLAEFFQGEGFIIGDDLSLADLMGFIKEYYAKFGLHKIKFKPTYNPYTEPSMEAHYYDSKLKKWYALINSGIFRPETLKPFGLENKTIIAWGMGASRVATLLANKNSMREITGATCDFDWLKKRPVMTRRIVR